MTKLRHLVWMLIATGALVLSTSQGFAQSRPDADEPGLIADDSYQLDPEWQKQVVYYRTNEAPGTIIVSTAERHLYLVQGNGRALRYGIGENLYGYGEIAAFRAGRPAAGLMRRIDRTVITTYGRDTAIASTLFYRDSAPGRVGRQMQTWIRFPEGWRIVAAHVSVIDEPKGV